jgi:hypothetical protein
VDQRLTGLVFCIRGETNKTWGAQISEAKFGTFSRPLLFGNILNQIFNRNGFIANSIGDRQGFKPIGRILLRDRAVVFALGHAFQIHSHIPFIRIAAF